MVQDYDGVTVVDAAGERVGTVERSYVDESGRVRVVALKLGRLFGKHRLVPVEAADRAGEELRIPYTKQMVEDSPDIDANDTLEGETLARVRAYYAGTQDRERGDAPDERQGQQPSPREQEREAAVRDVGPGEARDAAAMPADEVQEMGRVRDRGDVIEVPIVEEELVKRPVVKEVLRIRKDTLTDRQQVNEELRKEDVEVEREGDVDVNVREQRRS